MSLMNRLLNKTNKKDKFIINTLLPYLVDYLKESKYDEKKIEQVKSLCVFPYKDVAGTRLGSLNEPGITWFFNREEKNINVNSGSYRIIDLSMLPENDANKFRETFHEYCRIEDFSETAIINDLLKKMSQVTEYSKQWWRWAYDVFCLWKEDYYLSLKKATDNKKNKSFLFLKDNCSGNLKNKMLKYNLFEDILNSKESSYFWDKIETQSEKNKAIEMLKGMGVPYEFINNNGINPIIIDFFEEIAEEVEFPVIRYSKDYEKCELCHDILFELYKNNFDILQKVLCDKDLKDLFVIKNIYNDFVPLSWDMFYSVCEFKDLQKYDAFEGVDYSVKKADSNLEIQHIDVTLYDIGYLDLFDNIYAFSDVKEKMEEYSLGINVEEIDFYKWIWNYSRHNELIQNILFYYSNKKELFSKEDVRFVLEVLARESIEDKGYCFYFEVDVETAFKYSNVINKINMDFKNIKCGVDAKGEILDKNIILQILHQVINNVSEYQKIVTDEIWDRVYIVGSDNRIFYGKYVYSKDKDGKTKILLWKSQYNKSYIEGLASFISEFFGVEISKVDWKKEYINLIKGIREIINQHYDIIPDDELNEIDKNLKDIETFGEEKNLWLRLKEQRKKFIDNKGEDGISKIVDSRVFLKAKYNGRCQLCHNIAPKNLQDTYFFTYRIIKESENQLYEMSNNLFCLCPTCHGKLRCGWLMGQDLSDIAEKATKYVNYLEDKLSSNEMEDHFPCLVQEFVDCEENIKGFRNPIICNVIVNGKKEKMVFSWEHFIRIAFIFADINDFDE